MDMQRRETWISEPKRISRSARNLGRHLLAASNRAFLDSKQTALGRVTGSAKPRIRNPAGRHVRILQLGGG